MAHIIFNGITPTVAPAFAATGQAAEGQAAPEQNPEQARIAKENAERLSLERSKQREKEPVHR